MWIVTIKLPKWRRWLLPGLAALLVFAAILGLTRCSASTAFAPQENGDAACRALLSELGWLVVEAPDNVEDCVLSDNLSTQYLEMQVEAGFDLSQYIGCTVTRYTYRVLNYPTGDTDVLADLLVLDGAVIGGDIRSAGLDGFMHSLVMPT